VVAALRSTGISAAAANPEWYAAGMGQRLFYPPNVAGWPQNDYWISSSDMWARSGFARNLTWIAEKAGVLGNTESLPVATAVQQAFDTFGIDRPSSATRAALEHWLTAERAGYGWGEQPNLITLTILSPDFQLA
jgi:uncharacterized protein (DUF1800 family)